MPTAASVPAQPLPPKILAHPETEAGTGIYRVLQPCAALAAAGYAITKTSVSYYGDDDLALASPDVVVFRCPYDDKAIDAFRRYRRALPKATLVWDLDDILWEIPDHNPFKPQFPANMRARLQKSAKGADVVTVSTRPLAAAVNKDLGIPLSKIVVLPNTISQAFVNAARSVYRQPVSVLTSRPRVGWAGGDSHARDLALIADAVNSTKDRIQWVFMGSVPDGVDRADIEFHPSVPYEQYPRALADLRLDLAVVPLEDSVFNSCKSDLRILELAATGACVLASRVPATAGAPVAFVDDPADWTAEILRLVASPQELEARAEAQHQWVIRDRVSDRPANVLAVAEAWRPLFRDVFVPGTAADTDYPEKPFVYIRPGCEVSAEQLDYATVLAESYGGAVCAITNDGDYPLAGRFTPLSAEAKASVTAASAKMSAADDIRCPHPTGPFVVIAPTALAEVGYPDSSLDFELAAVEWGNRARARGLTITQVPSLFVACDQQRTFSEDDLRRVLTATAFWYPEQAKAASAMLKATDYAYRPRLDCAHFVTLRDPAEGGARVLLINADEPTTKAMFAEGHIAIGAVLAGTALQVAPEYLPNVPVFDLRQDLMPLAETLHRLRIDFVVLNGLKTGSPDALGALMMLKSKGFNVQYEPYLKEAVCPRLNTENDLGPCGDAWKQEVPITCQACVDRCGSAFGYVSTAAYRASWVRFLEGIMGEPALLEPDADVAADVDTAAEAQEQDADVQ